MTTSHKEGDWAIWDEASLFASNPDYRAGEIYRVTKKTVVTPSPWSSREHRRPASAILWSGPESEARSVVERLVSSVGLMKDEVRRSQDRHAKRAAELLSKATGATASTCGTQRSGVNQDLRAKQEGAA